MRPDHSPATQLQAQDLAVLIEPLLQEGLILFNATKVLEFDGTKSLDGTDGSIRSGDPTLV
jgi:hypothetical protein